MTDRTPPAGSPADGARPSRVAARRKRRRRRRRVAAAIAAGVIAAAGATTGGLWLAGRGGPAVPAAGQEITGSPSDTVGNSVGAGFTDPATAAAVLLAARTSVQTVDSYDYRTLARDHAAGQAVSTGVFRASYDAAMTGDVAQQARAERTVQTCTVQKSGIVTLDASARQAVVLVYAVLSVTDTGHPDAQRSPVTLNVTMQRDAAGTWLIAAMSDLSRLVPSGDAPPGTADLRAAASAARQEVTALINYRRAEFAADFQRSLAGLGAVAASQQEANRDAISAAMTAGHYDLGGEVVEVAVEDAGFDAATLLVSGHRYRQADGGTRTALADVRAEVVMAKAGGRWLVVRFTTVGVD